MSKGISNHNLTVFTWNHLNDCADSGYDPEYKTSNESDVLRLISLMQVSHASRQETLITIYEFSLRIWSILDTIHRIPFLKKAIYSLLLIKRSWKLFVQCIENDLYMKLINFDHSYRTVIAKAVTL